MVKSKNYSPFRYRVRSMVVPRSALSAAHGRRRTARVARITVFVLHHDQSGRNETKWSKPEVGRGKFTTDEQINTTECADAGAVEEFEE